MVKIFTFARFAFGSCSGLENLCRPPQKPLTIAVGGVALVSCLARLLCRTNRVFLRSSKKGIGSLWAYPFAYNTTFALFVKSKVQNLHYQKSLHFIFCLYILETNFYYQVIIKFLSSSYTLFAFYTSILKQLFFAI